MRTSLNWEAKADIVHSVNECGCAGILWDSLITRAVPGRIRGVREYVVYESTLPLPVPLLSMYRWESDRILWMAEQLGQTGKHFIWILSKSAIGDRAQIAPTSFYPGLLGQSPCFALHLRVIIAICFSVSVTLRSLIDSAGSFKSRLTPYSL